MSHRSFVIFCMILIGCASLTFPQMSGVSGRAFNVSLIRLIASPKVYEGRRLRLVGCLDHNGLDRAVGLYVTELDAQNFVISNSIDLHVEESSVKALIGKYVILEGTYHAPAGSLSDYMNGYLDHVSDVKMLRQGDFPK